MKILLPPAPVPQPDQVFGTKRNTMPINLEPSRRPPLPVFIRGEAWLIDFRTGNVRNGTWRYGRYTFICGKVDGRRKVISIRTRCFLTQNFYLIFASWDGEVGKNIYFDRPRVNQRWHFSFLLTDYAQFLNIEFWIVHFGNQTIENAALSATDFF